MNKLFNSGIAFMITLSLSISSVNMQFAITKAKTKANEGNVIKTEIPRTNKGTSNPKVVEEIVSDRTTDSTTFLLSNGMKQTTYYSDDIYFVNESGQLSEYDNEFVKLNLNDKKQVLNSVEVEKQEKEKYVYVNKKGDSKQFLPKKLSSETPVVMTKNNFVLSFSPTDTDDKKQNLKNVDNILSSQSENISLISQSVTNIYDGSHKSKKTIANYDGKDTETEISYESMEHGLKEAISLKNKPENNIISFNLTLQNSYAKLDEFGGGISIYSQNDDIVGGIEAPFMNDSTENNYSEKLHYELFEISEKNNVHKYQLKLVIDEKYLNNAIYPITIDPTITWHGATDLPETYVLKSMPTINYYSSGVKTFSVGNGNQGVFRTYFKAKELANTVKNKYIDSAILTIYENGSSVSNSTIHVKPVADSFKCNTINWDNQPGGKSTTLASFKSKGAVNTKHELNLKTWVQNVAKGSGAGNKCYGLLLKAANESGSSYVKFYGARSEKKTSLKVIYYDAPSSPSRISAKCVNDSGSNYIKSGEKLRIDWSGILSHALSYVQYKIADKDNNTLNGYEYSQSTQIGSSSSGNAIINVNNLKDGIYKICVRGVDKGGVTGKDKSAIFYIDKTKPIFTKVELNENTNVNIYSNDEPKLVWKVNDTNFNCIQISINNNAYRNFSDKKAGEEEIAGLVSGQANIIKVRAIDKAGNTSNIQSFSYYYDNEKPYIDMSITPNTNSEKMDNSVNNPILKYTITDKTLKNFEIMLNDEKIDIDKSSGEIILNNIIEGQNIINITAEDKAGNNYERELSYYRDTSTPESGTIKITPKTGLFNSSNKIPIVKWHGIVDDNLLCIQVKINDGEFKILGLTSNGEGQLQSSDFKKNGKYIITVRGIDKAGNVSDEICSNYYFDSSDYKLDDYTPTNVYVKEEIGGNTILRFSTKTGKYRDDVKYQVYRSTSPNVIISDKTLLNTYSSNGAIRMLGNEGVTYYYKIRAVKKDNGEMLYSDYSNEISSTTISTDEKNKRLGINIMYTYSSISTPNGKGQIELSNGNFYYEQNDISLPAVEVPVNISRKYNSHASQKTIFGYGWSNEYDAYVSECHNKIYYVDGTGAIYTFILKDNQYVCSENSDLSLEIDDDVLTKKIENSELKNNEFEINVHSKISNKNGEIYRFDDVGRLVLIEEANGSFVHILYDQKNGNIYSVITNRGQQANFEYNDEGLVNRIVSGDGDYGYSYTYDNDYLTKATYIGINGKSIDYKYSYKDGVLSTIIDAEGNIYEMEYYGKTISKFINPIGEYTSFNFDSDEHITTVTSYIENYSDIEPDTDTFKFNSNGQLLQKHDNMGNTLYYKYDKDNISLVADEKEENYYYALVDGIVTKKISNNQNSVKYNDSGNIVSEKDEYGNITTYEYKDFRNEYTSNLPTRILTTDATGEITSNHNYVYDEKGNVLFEKDLIENTIGLNKYNDDGTLSNSEEYLVSDASKVKNNNSDKLETILDNSLKIYDEDTEYNDVGDETIENITEGTVKENISYIYDKYGNSIKEIDNSSGTIIEYKYDEFFRTIETKEIFSKNGKTITKITKNKFNKNGSVIQNVDENGRITNYAYDSLNRVIKTTIKAGVNSKSTSTSYAYGSTNVNKGGKYELINNVLITTVYNENGELLSQSFVDSNGMKVKELSNGLYVDYTYDSSGKIFTTYTNGINQNEPNSISEGVFVVNTYDEKGNQTATITNPEIIGDTFKIGKNSIVTTSEYDQNGNVIKKIDAQGNQTKYEYDEQGRIIKVTTPSNSTNTFSYDELMLYHNS